MALINEPINLNDNFIIIRDKIVVILVTEIANQIAIDMADGGTGDDYRADVYVERSNPFESLKNSAKRTPVINVWFDRSEADRSRSNQFQRQHFEGMYNIDVIANGVSTKLNVGQTLGDEQSFRNAQRIVALIRNILMSAQYRYLDMRGIVTERWFESVESYRPDPDKAQSTPNIGGNRISFGVGFNEFDPQIALETLEEINIQVKRELDGKIILNSEFE